MPTIVTGVVANGLIVPSAPLPEGTQVEIHVQGELSAAHAPLTPSELRKLPRHKRQAILAVAAEIAESDYRDDKELTGE